MGLSRRASELEELEEQGHGVLQTVIVIEDVERDPPRNNAVVTASLVRRNLDLDASLCLKLGERAGKLRVGSMLGLKETAEGPE